MPDFGNPFSGNDLDRQLTLDEAIRALRFSVAAEYEATQLYEQIANAVADPNIKALMRDIANEEIEHAGEFLYALKRLSPQEFKFYQSGMEEAKELMEKKGSVRTASTNIGIIPKPPVKIAGFIEQFKILLKNLGGLAKNIAQNIKPVNKDEAIATTLEMIGKYGRPAIERSLDKLLSSAAIVQAAGMPSKEEISELLSSISSLIDEGAENRIESKGGWLVDRIKEMKGVKANIHDITTRLDLISSEIQEQDPIISMAIDKISDQLEKHHG